MKDRQEQIKQLKQSIDKSAAESKKYLGQLQEKLRDYDEKSSIPTAATKFLEQRMNDAKAAVDRLNSAGLELTKQADKVSDQSIEYAQQSLQTTQNSLSTLKSRAKDYDHKFLGDDMANSLESVVNASLQKSTDAIEIATDQVNRMTGMAKEAAQETGFGIKVVVGEAARIGEKVDGRLGITSRVGGLVWGVVGIVKSVDRRLHTSDMAKKVDRVFTGGLTTRLVNRGWGMVEEVVDYAAGTIENAKIAAANSKRARALEQKIGMAEEAVESTAVHTKDHIACMTCQASQKAMDTAQSAKETVMGATQSTSQSAQKQVKSVERALPEVTSTAKGGISKGVSKGQDTASDVQEKAQSAKREIVGEPQAESHP